MQFVDLPKQYQLYKEEIQERLDAVLTSCRFINGPAVAELEKALSENTGSPYVIACSSGTDALLLGLLALGVKAGDEVLVPDFTFIATAEVVSFLGAVPVFVDVEPDTLNIDPAKVEGRISDRTVGMIPVSLYGQCAEFDELNRIASAHGLWIMEDGAQSYGATYNGRKSCTLTSIATTSFFPAKPLGCYGDGGAIFTDDETISRKLTMLRNHGQAKRYQHSLIGTNGRLDTIQAAVLLAKLAHFDDEVDARNKVAAKYTEFLANRVRTPVVRPQNRSVWAQYTIRTDKRDDVIAHLKTNGIPTAVHYPIPLHQQEAFAKHREPDELFPESLAASKTVVSLPMHPFLSDDEIETVAQHVLAALKQ